MKKTQLLSAIVSLGMLASAQAAEPMKPGPNKSKAAPASGQSAGQQQMDAKMQEMMANAQKYGSPNENHKVLDTLSGQWQFNGRMWMQPNSQPMPMQGTSDNQWIMGGRYLQQTVKSPGIMGQPFEGIGIMGYDNVRGEYTSVWLDNMSTGFMKSSAKYDAATKTFAENGSMSCPMTGQKDLPYRGTWKLQNDNQYSYETFTKAPDGSEFKSMEINYQRAGTMKSEAPAMGGTQNKAQ